ncbi:hypothetical protein EMCRGX_G029628 [Ephydatia muelleri]
MQDFGPCSAFSAERCESFNATVRAQNIYSNRLSPSRDICHHFTVQQHLRYLCDAPSGDLRSIRHPGALRYLSYPTIEGLQNDRGVSIQLLHCLPEKYVKVFAGIIARDSELVNAGDFMKLSLVRGPTPVIAHYLGETTQPSDNQVLHQFYQGLVTV